MEREAKDASSSAHAMGLQNGEPNHGKCAQARYKSAVNKLVSVLNKLGRAITLCESSLPTLRRTLQEDKFKGVKVGLFEVQGLQGEHNGSAGGYENTQG